jgi:hypothetical protein
MWGRLENYFPTPDSARPSPCCHTVTHCLQRTHSLRLPPPTSVQCMLPHPPPACGQFDAVYPSPSAPPSCPVSTSSNSPSPSQSLVVHMIAVRSRGHRRQTVSLSCFRVQVDVMLCLALSCALSWFSGLFRPACCRTNPGPAAASVSIPYTHASSLPRCALPLASCALFLVQCVPSRASCPASHRTM